MLHNSLNNLHNSHVLNYKTSLYLKKYVGFSKKYEG